jgi:beta-glucosidase
MDGWQDEVEAIVMSWYSGVRGGDALAALLFGDANFSGRLPISFASDAAHLPEFDNVSLDVEYGYFHGYRLLQRDSVAPLYPFGFGRSYTSFTLSNGTVSVEGEVLVATVDVANTGAVGGRETVQVYVGAPDSLGPRAPRDLRGFAQVEVAPGGMETVRVEVPLDHLRVWDTAAEAWALPEGAYVVEVGTDVETLPVRVVVDL